MYNVYNTIYGMYTYKLILRLEMYNVYNTIYGMYTYKLIKIGNV